MKKLFLFCLFILAPLQAQVPTHSHVVIVLEENHSYSQVAPTSMPYLTALGRKYAIATQYYASTHPSIGNYFMLTTGAIVTNTDSVCPSSFHVSINNVVRVLLLTGKTWKVYAEGLPSVGSLACNTGLYAPRHNPFVYLTDVQNSTVQRMNVVPFADPNVGFAHDLANNMLPQYAFVVPNQCDDAHNCSLLTADNWLKTNINPYVINSAFKTNGLLIVTFDEGTDSTHGGGQVYWTVAGPHVKLGYKSVFNYYQHQSTLQLTLQGLGITSGYPGKAATATSMAAFFK